MCVIHFQNSVLNVLTDCFHIKWNITQKLKASCKYPVLSVIAAESLHEHVHEQKRLLMQQPSAVFG